MDLKSNPLSTCQEEGYRLLQNDRHNIFLTGYAGSGKSFLTRHFLKNLDRKHYPIVASTGAAAVLVGGRTFHSFFGLGILEGGPASTIQRALKDKRLIKRLRNMEGFVLDEVSMISGPTLSVAELICRRARESTLPWGGARAIVVGDFAQLPPVNPHRHSKEWAFLEETWEKSNFVPVVLKEILRSEDRDYVEMLNFVREGAVNDSVRTYLNHRIEEDVTESRSTHLFPLRSRAEQLNLQRLAEIETPVFHFATRYAGNPKAIETLKKQAPIPDLLQIKPSALVMLRVNDPAYRFVNGSVGTIQTIHEEKILIELTNHKIVEIEPCAFSILDAEGEILATAINFPIQLAYATTIHKAQGATLDSMVCDLRQLWEPGQAYVALSRLRTGNGLTLIGWDEASIRADQQVRDFYRGLS
jgi:ATP-dependent DNA helicase PIF1